LVIYDNPLLKNSTEKNSFLFKTGYNFINKNFFHKDDCRHSVYVPNIVNEYFYTYTFSKYNFFKKIKQRFKKESTTKKRPDEIQEKKILFINDYKNRILISQRIAG
jgi:hypothetical protein